MAPENTRTDERRWQEKRELEGPHKTPLREANRSAMPLAVGDPRSTTERLPFERGSHQPVIQRRQVGVPSEEAGGGVVSRIGGEPSAFIT